MKNASLLLAGIVSSVVTAGGASAATTSEKPATAPEATSLQKHAEKEFGRVSIDGASAFEDIHRARMAIFDGKTDEASQLIADAQASLAKAKTDDTAFLKAEAALHAPSQTTPEALLTRRKDATSIAWIPIDSEIILGDTFQASPEKAAAVVKARKGLVKGEGAKALEIIKLAVIDVNYTIALAPLEASVAAIDEAAKLVASHDYYGASQSLRQAEAGIRYDEIDDVANVSGKANSVSLKGK